MKIFFHAEPTHTAPDPIVSSSGLQPQAPSAEPAHLGDEVTFVTDGAAPAFGLADHAVEQGKFSTLANKQFNTDVTGFADDAFLSGQGQTRLVSNFVIYPKQGFAELLIDPFI